MLCRANPMRQVFASGWHPCNTDPMSEPRLRLRLLLGRSVMVGPGKADLLGVGCRAVQRCWVGCTGSVLPHMRGEVRRLIARGIPELTNV